MEYIIYYQNIDTSGIPLLPSVEVMESGTEILTRAFSDDVVYLVNLRLRNRKTKIFLKLKKGLVEDHMEKCG